MHSVPRTWDPVDRTRHRTGARGRRHTGRNGFAPTENIRESLLPFGTSAGRPRPARPGERSPSPAGGPPGARPDAGAPSPAHSGAALRRNHDARRGGQLRHRARDHDAPVPRQWHDLREGQYQHRFPQIGLHQFDGRLQSARARRDLHLHDSRPRQHPDIHRDAGQRGLRPRNLRSEKLFAAEHLRQWGR
jgi:hypothetical protein